MPPPDLAGLLGIPFLDLGRTRAGADCYGLCLIAYAEAFGIALAPYDTVSARDPGRGDTFDAGASAPEWRVVPEAEARPLDVVLFRMRGASLHVGLHHSPGRMLHVEGGILSTVARLDHPRWRSLRRTYHRHRDRAA